MKISVKQLKELIREAVDSSSSSLPEVPALSIEALSDIIRQGKTEVQELISHKTQNLVGRQVDLSKGIRGRYASAIGVVTIKQAERAFSTDEETVERTALVVEDEHGNEYWIGIDNEGRLLKPRHIPVF